MTTYPANSRANSEPPRKRTVRGCNCSVKKTCQWQVSLSKKPRRVRGAHAAKELKSFSAAACTWQKIHLGPHTIVVGGFAALRISIQSKRANRPPQADDLCAAAGRILLSEKSERTFSTVSPVSYADRGYFAVGPPHGPFSLGARPRFFLAPS